MFSPPPGLTLFPYTTLFRSYGRRVQRIHGSKFHSTRLRERGQGQQGRAPLSALGDRSEEHTSELQSQSNLVCRLLLEKKNNTRSSCHARGAVGSDALITLTS